MHNILLGKLQSIDRLKNLLDKENITHTTDIFYSEEGLQSLDREPFSVSVSVNKIFANNNNTTLLFNIIIRIQMKGFI